jgi:hypothetical protein
MSLGRLLGNQMLNYYRLNIIESAKTAATNKSLEFRITLSTFAEITYFSNIRLIVMFIPLGCFFSKLLTENVTQIYPSRAVLRYSKKGKTVLIIN